jgi:hypothetical protein
MVLGNNVMNVVMSSEVEWAARAGELQPYARQGACLSRGIASRNFLKVPSAIATHPQTS